MVLPVEIYQEIVIHVSSDDDLRTLLYTSRVFRSEAERILLRSIDMDLFPFLHEEENQIKQERFTKLFEYIQSNPTLALAVQEVYYSPNVVSEDLTRAVFPLMANLTRLHISEEFHAIFNRCNFRLQFFSHSLGIHSSLKGPISELLATQTSITELYLCDDIDVHPGSLPNLRVLTCGSGCERGILRLLHGRRVARLRAYRELYNDDFMDQRSLEHLRVLASPRVERDFAWSALKKLEYLATDYVCRFL